jgi:uncharacterized membrane protein YgdD (TMEM256/DUF423 family)
MIEIALAIALVLTLIAVLLGCYAAEGLELDQQRRQPALDERGGQYLSHDGTPLKKAKGEAPITATISPSR